MSHEIEKVLKEANTAVTKGDYEGFIAHCSDDTSWTFVGDRTLQGKVAVRQWMSETYREPPRLTVSSLIASGEYLVAQGEVSVKNEQGIFETSFYCDVWRVEAGKLAELHAYVVKK